MSKHEAIQKDVSTDEEVNEEKEIPRSQRDEHLDSIALRRQDRFNDEPTEEPAEEIADEPEMVTHKLKVDGEEIDVDQDKIIEAGIRTLQKESSADKKLEEASRLLKEAKETASNNYEEFDSPSDDVDEVNQEFTDAEQLAHAMQYGTEEEAAQAVETIMAQKASATDTNETVNQVRMQIEHEAARDRFKDEFPDVWDDPNLRAIAIAQENKMRDEGDERNFWDVRKQVGEDVRKWRDSHKPTDSGLKDKRKRKGSIDTLSDATAPMESKQVASTERKSASDVLAEIAKSRGKIY